MRDFSISPWEAATSLWRHRSLVRALTVREVIGRYKGSLLGIAWSLFNPLLMLAIYTFFFAFVFKSRWSGVAEESKVDFAIILFVGLIVHGLFAECVNRAPGIVLANANYVKKVVFPLEVLPWVTFGSALFHAGVSIVVLVLAKLAFTGHISWTALLFPIVLAPLMLVTMGVTWFLAALGVYLRDLVQITGVVTTVLLFMSPVFYPMSAIPPRWQPWFRLNPLTVIIEEGRNTLVFGKVPDFETLAADLVVGVVVAWLGFAWFQKWRRGFSDVL